VVTVLGTCPTTFLRVKLEATNSLCLVETMRKITKNSSLYDIAPNLVKEWHPSANGILIPTKVTVSFSKKVWWICRESHEWQATIQSRLNGNGCPVCKEGKQLEIPLQEKNSANSKNNRKNGNTPPRSSSAFFEPDTFKNYLGPDYRKTRRYQLKATAVIESWITGHLVYADVKNFSAGGMCFETDARIDPGTTVIIKLDRPLFISDQKEYDSIIRWCEVLDSDNQSFATHSMGAKFI